VLEERANEYMAELQQEIHEQQVQVKEWKEKLEKLELHKKEHEQQLTSPHTKAELQEELKAKVGEVEKLKEAKMERAHQLEDTIHKVEESTGSIRESAVRVEASHDRFAFPPPTTFLIHISFAESALTTIEELQAEVEEKSVELRLQQVQYEELKTQLMEKEKEIDILKSEKEKDRAQISELESKLVDFDFLVNRVHELDESISELQVDQVLTATAKLLLRKVKQVTHCSSSFFSFLGR
jgi:chromosome segregation ATPase